VKEMKYRRLKTLDSTGVPVMRYYKLAEGETAYCNCFYEVDSNGEAKKISGTPTEGNIIGFSHGGNNLAKGLILLDINETPLYMGILAEGETQPTIATLVNGYQVVVDTHYEAEETGKNDEGFGMEMLDVPYYIFHILQAKPTNTGSVDDAEAGEISPINQG
jgi:hypothetical protein